MGRDQSLFYRFHRQGQTLQGISPKEGWSMVFSEDHESSDILAVDACPGLPVVHIDPSSVGQQESTFAHWRDPQFTQQPGGQRSVCGTGIYRRFYVPSVHAVHAGNPQRPTECSHRRYLSFAHYASYSNPCPMSLTGASTRDFVKGAPSLLPVGEPCCNEHHISQQTHIGINTGAMR